MKRRQVLRSGLALALLAALPRRAGADELPPGLDPVTGLFADDRALGDPAAPVVLIEYASLSCPHCASFHAKVLPRLKADWIDSGRLLFVYRHFPLDAPALRAALLAECLEGEAYFAFIERLYRDQQLWIQTSEVRAALFAIAQQAGFDEARFESCANDQAMIDRIVAQLDYGRRTYGLRETPTVIVEGALVEDPHDYEALDRILEAAQGD
jgi:protein-disulfide isomerase